MFPDLRFCPVPSPNPLGSAASASAHGLSGVQYSAPSFASGLLALFLSACSLILLTSACCSFRYLFCTSLSTFGFPSAVPFTPRWWLLRLPWRWLQILRLGCLPPFLAPFILPLTSCAFFCCLHSSPDFWLFAVSSSFSCALCVVLPAQASLLRSFLSPGSSGVALPSLPLLFASLLPGGI